MGKNQEKYLLFRQIFRCKACWVLGSNRKTVVPATECVNEWVKNKPVHRGASLPKMLLSISLSLSLSFMQAKWRNHILQEKKDSSYLPSVWHSIFSLLNFSICKFMYINMYIYREIYWLYINIIYIYWYKPSLPITFHN